MKHNTRRDVINEMTCFECGAGTLLPAELELSGSRHGETFAVRTRGLRCGSCGFQTLDSKDSVEFTRLVSEAYCVKHNLLTSAEIRAHRERFNMSVAEFADYLGVGTASVKRWEAGQIQERGMDELIRLKTEPEAARRNLKNVESQSRSAVAGISRSVIHCFVICFVLCRCVRVFSCCLASAAAGVSPKWPGGWRGHQAARTPPATIQRQGFRKVFSIRWPTGQKSSRMFGIRIGRSRCRSRCW